MKKPCAVFVLLFLLLGVCMPRAQAQTVTVDASMDSMQIFIGQQTQIRLHIVADTGQKIILPVLVDTLTQGVEILGKPVNDTIFLNDRKRLELTQTYTITSFDSALYYIPPFHVTVGEQEYESKALALKVYSVPVDVEHPDQFFPLRDVMRPPFAWEDWSAIFWISLLLIPLFLLTGYLIVRLRDNKPILRILKQTPKLPPHQQALEEIERIKKEKPWERDQEKEYYTQLTDTLRTYIKDRYGFNAMEMTSREIIAKLTQIAEDKDDFKALRSLFTTADLVKFAKWKPEMNENDYNLLYAIEFVNETKQNISEEEASKPVEVTVEEKRSKRMKIVLAAGIILLSVAILSLMAYVLLELSNLLI